MSGRDAEDTRVDLSALDPRQDASRFGALVGGVMAAAAGELARRRRGPTIWDLYARWRRPVLAGAGALAAAAAAVLLLTPAAPARSVSLAEAGGVPGEWVDWTGVGRNPTPGELLAMEHPAR